METFTDFYGNTVRFVFSKREFKEGARHVFVICRYKGSFVLTNHKKRGLEFPGGKAEPGETLEEAVVREVYEETGGIVGTLFPIAQYEVVEGKHSFLKNVYFAELTDLKTKGDYLETFGPVLTNSPFRPEDLGEEYSFVMKDRVLQLCLDYLRRERLI